MKSVRNQFLEHYGLHKLEPHEREFFKDTVHDVYFHYTNQQNGQQSQGDNIYDLESLTDLLVTFCCPRDTLLTSAIIWLLIGNQKEQNASQLLIFY